MSRLAGSPAGRVLAAVCSCLAAATAIGYAARLPPSAALATALAALAASALGSRRNALLVALLVGVAALGLARGATAVERPGPGTIDGHLGAREVMVTGTVRSADPGGGAVVVDVSHLTDASSDAPVSGGLLLSSARLPDLAPDDTVEVDASGLRAPGRRPGAESRWLPRSA